MKRLYPIILIFMMLSLTGCLEFTEMTPEETEKVAQGTAWYILNHNKLYGEKLSTPTPTPSPSPTPTWFPTSTPSPTPAPTSEAQVTEGAKPTPTKAPDKDENQYAFMELKDVIGIEDMSLEFGGYECFDNYTVEGYSIEASSADTQLMAIRLVVKNNSYSPLKVDLAGKMLEYRLDYKAGENLKPLMTILPNDFTTLRTTIDGGARYETVLMFEVKRGFEPEILNLFIMKDKKAVIVKLK